MLTVKLSFEFLIMILITNRKKTEQKRIFFKQKFEQI